MKNFLLIIFMFLCCTASDAQIIQGGVEYTADTALRDLLNSPIVRVEQDKVKLNIIDENYRENSAYSLSVSLKDRTLAKFSDGSYGIIYNDDQKHVWYYGADGLLTHCEVKTSLDYPYKTYKYTPGGKLVNMSLRVSRDETFIYSPAGKLIAHWLGEKCYDEQNNIIMTRHYE